MSVYSPAYYVKELQDFYDLIIESNKDLNTKFSEAPHYQRFQIYAHFGFVTDFFELQEPPNRNALVLKDINSSA